MQVKLGYVAGVFKQLIGDVVVSSCLSIFEALKGFIKFIEGVWRADFGFKVVLLECGGGAGEDLVQLKEGEFNLIISSFFGKDGNSFPLEYGGEVVKDCILQLRLLKYYFLLLAK